MNHRIINKSTNINQQGKGNTFGYLQIKNLRESSCSVQKGLSLFHGQALDGSELRMRGLSFLSFCNKIKNINETLKVYI